MRVLLLTLLLLTPSLAYASGGHGNPHHDHNDDGGDTNVTNINKAGDAEGVALAIATAQCQFDFGTYRLQGCVSAGQYEETKAINFGVGKRFLDNRALFNGSIGLENGKAGIGAAVNWRF